ncbi:MAG: hypothetical protein ACRD6X_18915 [Pyrinomonadaceae bacterium]
MIWTDQGGRPVWIDNDEFEKMSNKNMYKLWTENEYNSDRGRVRLNPNGPDSNSSDADARSGFSIIGPNIEPESNGTIIMGGVAVAASDGFQPGPADLFALAYIIGSLANAAATHERLLPLAPTIPQIMMNETAGEAAKVSTPLTPAAKKKLGNLAGRAGEKVADVIKSRGGTGANVQKAGEWAGKTLGEAATAAAAGNEGAKTAIKIAKEANRLGQRY